jgi:hypothetical protein
LLQWLTITTGPRADQLSLDREYTRGADQHVINIAIVTPSRGHGCSTVVEQGEASRPGKPFVLNAATGWMSLRRIRVSRRLVTHRGSV